MNKYPARIYLNDQIVTYQNAKISVFDRGFLFGDGVYEVMVQKNGKIFRQQDHLHRFDSSLEKVGITFDTHSISERVSRLLEASQLNHEDCLIYMQVTRGIAPRKHAFPKDPKPSFMMYASPISMPEINLTPVVAVTMPDFRWSRCDIKMTSLLGNVMASDYASKQGAYEALLVREGKVTEASHCNVFFVKNEIVYTHPANEHILAGITRKIVLELCEQLALEVIEEAVSQKDIMHMDEAFLTGSSTQIASIKQVDQYLYYENDSAGPITKKLQQAFARLRASQKPATK